MLPFFSFFNLRDHPHVNKLRLFGNGPTCATPAKHVVMCISIAEICFSHNQALTLRVKMSTMFSNVSQAKSIDADVISAGIICMFPQIKLIF